MTYFTVADIYNSNMLVKKIGIYITIKIIEQTVMI